MKSERIKYPSLPVMQCDSNCGECCGPVPCSEWEFQQVAQLAEQRQVAPKRQGLTCPWYQDGKCQVYEARPMLCRLMGHCDGLVCAKGYSAPIPEKKERKIMRWYKTRASRMLHEVFEDWQDLVTGSL